jgi:lysophospholipase L1-like esterase
MDAAASTRRGLLVRIASGSIALLLVAWALADDALIGGGPGFGWSQRAVLAAGLALATCCALPLEWNRRALAAAVSTLLALALAEVGLRLLFTPRYYAPFEPDSRLLYRLVPGAERERRLPAADGGERITYRVNRAGFRGDELEARGRATRVVVYGDSFIQAEFSRLENTFAERLEWRLAERTGKAVEVVNAGVAGYGPDQILRKLERELDLLDPALVIVAIYAGNDFGDLVRNKLYRLDSDGSLRENEAALSPSLAANLGLSGRESIVKRIGREARRALARRDGREALAGISAPARMEAWLRQARSEWDEYAAGGDPVVRELLRDPYNADVSLTPHSDSARYKVELMDRLLGRMHDLAVAHEVPLVLVLIPHPIDVCGGHESGEVDRRLYPEYRPTALTDALASIAERRGIPYVDLFGPFEEHGARELYFRSADDHWNDFGQRVGADRVAEFLLSRGLLAAPERRG